MYPYSGSSRLVASPGFPGRLIERMDRTGFGTLELAEAAEVNKETISLWRAGKQKGYTYEKVARVARPLGTTAETLLDLPVTGQVAPEVSTPPKLGPSAPQEELVRRIAKLGPVIERLSELEEVVAEARKLSQD